MNRCSLALLGTFLTAAGPAGAQARVAINLITHSTVTIDRPAAAVWPKIIDPSDWKQGAKVWHHAGPVGQVGELFGAGDPADKAKPAFYIENSELLAQRRRTIKLFAPAGELIGFAVWALRESGGKTVVAYDVYSETLIDPVQAKSMTADQVRELERSASEENQRRFDRELVELKRLVEGRR